jgi:hypothetical protein
MQNFEEFLTTHAGEISLIGLAVNIVGAAFLCSILAWVYVKFGTTLSNRTTLAKTFLLVGVTTTLIITVVKSSLALSLGLVGALSIVRFRAAIKEPEELGYLFLTIAIGLGFGADQRAVTLIAFFLIIALILLFRAYTKSRYEQNNLFLKIRTRDGAAELDVEKLVSDLSRSCSNMNLRRFEEHDQGVEVIFTIVVDSFSDFIVLRNQLKEQYQGLDITFVEDIRLT